MALKRLNTVTAERAFESGMRRDRMLKTLFAVMLDLENRLRALEGRPTVTAAQARAALKTTFTR